MVAFITSGCALVGVLVSVLVPLAWKQRKVIAEVRDQVANSHSTTNLRDDLDRVLDGISLLHQGQRQHTEDISNLRTDIAWERRERMDLARRVEKLAA